MLVVAAGPINVTLYHVGEVLGEFVDPLPSLSLSNPLDCEASAIAGSRKDNKNCNFPL
ncbi:MAG: hypothetical protein FD122_520 [Stygiobacter sp.]|nr:MAG: hypothetical protein FD122_520 [Stygiobacter sp.]